ncbi:hypothetical protein ACXR2W_07460 [Leucobacter sp. HY1908]
MHLVTGRPRSTLALAALFATGALLLAGCADNQPGEVESNASTTTEWAAVGPFELPERVSTDFGMTGSGDVKLPDGTIARLDANQLLGTGPDLVALPDRDNYKITAEQYSYTYDGDEPLFVGVVQATHTMHYRGYTEDEFVTYVLGISATADPQELSRTRILRGGEHTASIAGRSDHGVVAVLLDGVLNTNVAQDSRVVGVDAVRATEVWSKEHGYPGYGDGTAMFYLAVNQEACATEMQRYDVASGVIDDIQKFPNTDVETGGVCFTADQNGLASATQ